MDLAQAMWFSCVFLLVSCRRMNGICRNVVSITSLRRCETLLSRLLTPDVMAISCKWNGFPQQSVRFVSTSGFLKHRRNISSPKNKYYDKSQKRSDIPLKPLHEVISLSQFLLEEIPLNIENDNEVTSMKNQLTNLLFQLYLQDEIEKFLNLFEKMQELQVCTEASYIILMKYFVELNDYENVKKYFDQLNNDDTIEEIHSRAYIPLLNVCLRSAKYHLIPQYFAELCKLVKVKFQDQIFIDIINTCTEVLYEDNEEVIRNFVNEIFMLFEFYGSGELYEETLTAITHWFER